MRHQTPAVAAGANLRTLSLSAVAMLSRVLKSDRAVHVNIAIMRAFIKLREIFATHREPAQKIEELERHQKHDAQIQSVFDAIRQLLEPLDPSTKRRIGFTA
jgi:hypothetical protein